jgi:sugar transferase (PEP-CTERM/EpsH1 system associated)
MGAAPMTELSILFVTARFPLPLLSGDRNRAFHQLRWLSQRHRVTLVTHADKHHTAPAQALLEQQGVRVITVPFSRAGAAMRIARAALTSDLPLQTALYNSAAARETVRSLIESERFDLAHIQLARTVPLLDAHADLPRVVDLIDALSLNMRRRADHDRGWLRWAARMDAARLQRYERVICEDAGAALVVASPDRDAIGPYPSLHIVPNGVDLTEFPYVPAFRDPHQLVFTGNLGYFPNIDAVSWFVDQVLPLVWQEAPDTRLTIAGARPARRILAYAQRDPRITVAGDVEHLHPVLSTARVAVAPMRAGSGQLLKVLEAMSSGTPVVTTSRGLSGIDATPGQDLLVADTPAAFAAHVVSLIRDNRLSARLASAGRSLVERLYTWERSAADLERIYLKVLSCARTDARSA